MNIEDLKKIIISYNNAYRAGNSEISDEEYDKLVDEFKANFPNEYDEFRDSLNEGLVEYGTKVKHPYIMGSLDKVTIEKPEDIKKFLNKYVKTSLNVSAKVDGISCRLHYSNGKLVQAATRGKGTEGTDITDKIFYVKNIPTEIPSKEDLDIRGELVILKNDFSFFTEFANPRNATAGIINRKDWTKDDVSKISFICYTILGKKYIKSEQFKVLENNGFITAWHKDYLAKDFLSDSFISELTDRIIDLHDYETDGLVISSSDYINEDEYRPDAAVAVKGNLNSAITTIIDVEWRGPSKNGKFVPVAQLEPVELCGTTVSQATMNNLDFISKLNLKYGSKVKIQKRGEIIPMIIEVISNKNSIDFDIPTECPCCGSTLVKDGPFIWCKNKNCQEQTLKQLTLFIKKLNVKHASEATLKNFKIFSFDDLIKFIPDKKYKLQMTLYKELQEKVFNKSKLDLFAATNFEDLSEILITKIVDFYGFENIEAGNYVGLPDGIGDITLEKFKEDALNNLNIVNKFINDSRYNYLKVNKIQSKAILNINGSVCFTGSLSISRSEASRLAKLAGYEVKSDVNKNLTYLITNTPNSGSSKNKKAQKFGIKVITEDEFMKLISNISKDIFDI